VEEVRHHRGPYTGVPGKREKIKKSDKRKEEIAKVTGRGKKKKRTSKTPAFASREGQSAKMNARKRKWENSNCKETEIANGHNERKIGVIWGGGLPADAPETPKRLKNATFYN